VASEAEVHIVAALGIVHAAASARATNTIVKALGEAIAVYSGSRPPSVAGLTSSTSGETLPPGSTTPLV